MMIEVYGATNCIMKEVGGATTCMMMEVGGATKIILSNSDLIIFVVIDVKRYI